MPQWKVDSPTGIVIIMIYHLGHFQSKQRDKEHEEGEPEQRVRVPPPGAPHPARAARRVLRPVPGHVPDHGAGQPAHPPAHQAVPSPAHPHVLLPQPLGPH